MSILYVFFVHYCYAGKKKAKARRKRNNLGSREEDGKEYSNNNCGISFWIVFTWPEYSTSSFEENISRKFLVAGFDLISCKAILWRMLCIMGVTTGEKVLQSPQQFFSCNEVPHFEEYGITNSGYSLSTTII